MNFNWKIVGFEKQVNYLQKQIICGTINHAYLFIGPSQLGKFTIAKLFAQSLNCSNLENKPCNRCANCKQFKKQISADILIVEAEKNFITVENAREIKKFFNKTSSLNNYQISLINDIQKLNSQAANALLKILEEPHNKQIIIMIGDSINNIPKTILSRCQIINFLPLSVLKLAEYAKQNEYDEELIKATLNISCGYPGKFINFLNNAKKITSYQKTISELVDNIIRQELLNISVNNYQETLNNLLLIYRDLFLIKNNCNNFINNKFLKIKLVNLAKFYNLKSLQQIITKLIELLSIKSNINNKLNFENLVINFLTNNKKI